MDSLRNLKYIGYCQGHLPESGVNFDDFVRFCKFNLCSLANILMKDPIWDKYDDEEIIVEYFAHFYSKKPEEAQKLLSEISMDEELAGNVYDWLDDMVEANQKELKDTLPVDGEDEVDFSPEDFDK